MNAMMSNTCRWASVTMFGELHRMSKESPTLAKLQKSWWWNREDVRRNGVEGVTWPAVEIAARNYEVMRRSPDGKQYSSTYLEINFVQNMIIQQLWVTWNEYPMRTDHSPKDYLVPGWTPISEGVHRQWNLRVADKTLQPRQSTQAKLGGRIPDGTIARRAARVASHETAKARA
jgi:hypothetical protein